MNYISVFTYFVHFIAITYSTSRLFYHRNLGEDLSLPFPASRHELKQFPRYPKFRRELEAHQESEITPLYPGYGTHFSYVYVGSPPQRQSVIVDTGSHYTAFPCTGCSQCGQHTDPYWDVSNSSTANILKCNGQPCTISQSYSEGSSWHAFKVIDKLWVGGLSLGVVPDANTYAIDFLFGCQTSETGLFRTQLADGIMGLSMAEDTLPQQLVAQGVTVTNIFSLCFRVGGGIMTLGGVDQRIHLKPGIEYAALTSSNGWFSVDLIDVLLQDQNTEEVESLGGSSAQYNGGKGCIIDSGTTDTYLPASLATKFNEIFKSISTITYTTANVVLSPEDLNRMPNLIFVFRSSENNDTFSIEMPWSSYVDSVGGGKYAFRVYLTEGSGTVLGANFMNGYNIIFDSKQKRVGFAKSNCKYEDYVAPATRSPTVATTLPPNSNPGNSTTGEEGSQCISELIPIDACSAHCDGKGAYTVKGMQTWVDKCGREMPGAGAKECNIPCNDNKVVRGDPNCPDKAWTECPKTCLQTRKIPPKKRRLRRLGANVTKYANADGNCALIEEKRSCYTGSCPVAIGDYLIFIDLRIRVLPSDWSYVYSEDFYAAFSYLYEVPESQIELLNDAGSEYTMGVKLHFQIRLRKDDYEDTIELHEKAQSIPASIWSADFPSALLKSLNKAATVKDRIDYSRFGHLLPYDIEVLNAMALPMGDIRDPVEIPNDGGPTIITHIKKAIHNQFDLMLIGVALGALLVLSCVVCMYCRLKQEHAALEKDKVMGGSLRRMWNRFMHLEKMKGTSKGRGYEYREVQMHEFGNAVNSGALMAGDDELDESDLSSNRS